MLNPMQKMIEGAVSKLQENMKTAVAELEETRIEATSGGGVVKVTVNGLGEIYDIELDPQVVDPDEIEMLQDLICSAVREAWSQSQAARQEKLMSATPLANAGLDLQGLL
jgi:DNA-binding YbaB/EbfC family protein